MLEGCAAASSLDVEEPCRAFLEVAKACGAHLGALAWGDAGLAEQVGRLYAHPEWRSGTTMGTILATIGGEGEGGQGAWVLVAVGHEVAGCQWWCLVQRYKV
jgi:hypothetical protein